MTSQESTIEERSLKRPSRFVEVLGLHEDPDVLANSVRKQKALRILALLQKLQAAFERSDLPPVHALSQALVYGPQQIVLRAAESEKELRLPIEEDCP